MDLYLQPNIQTFSCGKIISKLSVLIVATLIFTGQNMTMDAYESGNILKGYIQESTIIKEQSNDALFLLQKNWEKNLAAKYGKNSIRKLDDGIFYAGMVKYFNSKRVKINVAEINRNINPDIEIIPQLAANKMHSKAKVTGIAKSSKAIIAVNGTYFKQNTGTPLGALVINNNVISGPIYDRVAFGIGKNDFKTARVSFRGELKLGEKIIRVNNINQPRMQQNSVIVYSSKWGVRTPVVKAPVTNISVKNGVVCAVSDFPAIIPEDGYVVSIPKQSVEGVSLGQNVELEYNLLPKWEDTPNIISGGPYLMKNGKIFIDASAEKLTAVAGKNPRTAIGYTKDNVMIIVTVDGRKEGSSGLTLQELAYLMKSLGCYEAINLDGGSSTAMYAGGNTYSGTDIKYAASVSNALVVRKREI